MRQCLALIAIALALPLAACQSTKLEDGAQVQFVREIMQESAKVSEGPPRAERAVQAVRDWRGEGGDG